MPDNDFWIEQEQIPVDLSLLLTYSNDEDYWYAPGEYALRVYTVDTLNTNFARPCFAFGEHSLTEAQVARIMNPEYRPEQQIALLTAMRGQTPVADLSDADFAGLFPASLSVEQMSACAYAVNRCGYNSPLLMMTMQACADMNAQQLMAVFDATAAEFSDATMAKVSTILMHTPALTSQQMRYLLAEARDGTPFPALESMKEHLLAQVEPEKAQVTETGIKSESRDMASGKEALAEQAGLDGTQKINQNKEME